MLHNLVSFYFFVVFGSQGRLGVSFPKLTLKDPDRVPSTYCQREVGDLVWVDPFPWDKTPIPRPIRYYEGVHYGAGVNSNRTYGIGFTLEFV